MVSIPKILSKIKYPVVYTDKKFSGINFYCEYDGIMILRSQTISVSASTAAYIYLERADTHQVVSAWLGLATGGQISMTVPLFAGKTITISTQSEINHNNDYITVIYFKPLGGEYSKLASLFKTLSLKGGVV